ncbi:hypothetical protein pEaSNUABM10_00194 [Erwinia phage pEa_SNUABM_10]|nr:hypothetical protein pEaSNUABM10_00194 [Erwinia phage pEa_SNUABM_10]
MDISTVIAVRRVLVNRNKVIAHFESFKDKLGELWKAVREANGDKEQLNADSQVVVFATNLPMSVRVAVMDKFCNWADLRARDVLGQLELKDNDVEIETYVQCAVERVGDSTFIKFTEELSGIERRIEITYYELAGMIAGGYNFSEDARLFFTVR